MRWARNLAPVALLLVASAALLSGCGDSASASGGDPAGVVDSYMKAVAGGNADAGQAFLEAKSDEKITKTDAGIYMSEHKGAEWKITPVSFIPPGKTDAEQTKSACLIGQPAPAQICVVTVEVDASGGKPVWFHFSVENRYGPWQIIACDRVDTKPDDLLPSGSEAHKA